MENNDRVSDTKKCPFCAEDIKVDAIVCKHCHSSLVAPIVEKDRLGFSKTGINNPSNALPCGCLFIIALFIWLAVSVMEVGEKRQARQRAESQQRIQQVFQKSDEHMERILEIARTSGNPTFQKRSIDIKVKWEAAKRDKSKMPDVQEDLDRLIEEIKAS